MSLGRDEVGVEDGDELAGGVLHAFGERAGLVADAVVAVDVLDRIALGGPFVDGGLGDLGGVVGGVVEHLDLEPVERVVEQAGGVDDPLGDHVLVVHRQLDGDARELASKCALGLVGVVLVLAIEVKQDVAVEAVEGRHQRAG